MSTSQELRCNNPEDKPSEAMETLLSYKLIWGYRQIRKLFNTSGKSNRRHRLGQYLLEQVGRDGSENM